MSATVTVVYPQGTKFDMDYYMSKHMPLVQKKWGPMGLKAWKVLKMPEDAPYCVQATLEFDNMEDFQKAGASEEAKEVLGDVKNFSDKDPVIMPGTLVGKS